VKAPAALHRHLEHGPVQEVDPLVLRQRVHEGARAKHAVFRVAPAREGFQALDLAGGQLDLGLEKRLELALLQADPDFLEGKARDGVGRARGRGRLVIVEQRTELGSVDRLGDGAEQVDLVRLDQGLD
jgi:hypothetical protein